MTHANIEYNLKTYLEAREIFPIIIDYENGSVSRNSLSKFGLSLFADFYEFKKRQEERGFLLIDHLSYRDIKPMMIENTKDDKFKTYITNRTQKEFISIFSDTHKFDRLLNGRVLQRSRRNIKRDSKKFDGLSYCIVPVINYIITNSIEFDKYTLLTSTIVNDTRWYFDNVLSYDDAPKKEIDLTRQMIDSFINVIDGSEIDYRKLNLDYITDTILIKLRELMIIPVGTVIKAKEDVYVNNIQTLTKDKSYAVKSSYVSSGNLRVMVDDDTGRPNYFEYRYFEDMSIKREQLLNQLFSK